MKQKIEIWWHFKRDIQQGLQTSKRCPENLNCQFQTLSSSYKWQNKKASAQKTTGDSTKHQLTQWTTRAKFHNEQLRKRLQQEIKCSSLNICDLRLQRCKSIIKNSSIRRLRLNVFYNSKNSKTLSKTDLKLKQHQWKKLNNKLKSRKDRNCQSGVTCLQLSNQDLSQRNQTKSGQT